jgi:hypothetical protein
VPSATPLKTSGSVHRTWLWLALGLPLGWIFQRLAAAFPTTTEQIYGRAIFPPVRRTSQWIAGAFPFSVAELFVLTGTVLTVALLVRGLTRAARRRASWREVVGTGLRRLAATAGALYLLFLLTWGFNYARPSLATTLELKLRPTEPGELAVLCAELSDRCEYERDGVLEDATGAFRLGAEGVDLSSKVGSAMRAAARRHPAWIQLDGDDPLLRFPWLSPLLSRLGITGIWSPFTAEAHVNAHVPDVLKPFTACHEAAHGRGFAREDEASFVAYVVGRGAPDRGMRYSSSLCTLRTALAQLARANLDLARAVDEDIDEATARDMLALDTYWRAQRSWITGVARRANDAYLRTQGDARGVQSYGRMVDLLLAERRQRGSSL